ncbi:MAG: hypothetical protein A3H32_14460 [Betaproteobacteria bacterium RIFCSPLOWO2_02_FULL_63_19]|nr:MAG: hypothetical protein A3H32_14460 [Betaproteobacteria bacterium RIFCSPLOWO2_02_FULL_63_19]
MENLHKTRDIYDQSMREGTVSLAEVALWITGNQGKGTPAYIAVIEKLRADVRAGRIVLASHCVTDIDASRVSEVTAREILRSQYYEDGVLEALRTGTGVAQVLATGFHAIVKVRELRNSQRKTYEQTDSEIKLAFAIIEWQAERILSTDPQILRREKTIPERRAEILTELEVGLGGNPVTEELLKTVGLRGFIWSGQESLCTAKTYSEQNQVCDEGAPNEPAPAAPSASKRGHARK